MAEKDEGGEKTEQATDAKREEFRRQGQVANTRELAGALAFFMAAGSIWMLGGFFGGQLNDLFQKTLGPDMIAAVQRGSVLELLQYAGAKTLILIFPFALLAAFIGFFSSLIQTGPLQVENALVPDPNRMNPINGLKKIFSWRGFAEGLKSIFKLLAVGLVLVLLLKSEALRIPTLMASTPLEIAIYLGQLASRLFFAVGALMITLAGADFLFQKWDLERRMMMSKQEVKEENKQREGDPQIKARVRRLQREMSQRRMMDAIPKADVVITNPTHIAIVLKYGDDLPAPQLVAKGADLIAEKIKAVARENNVPIVENKPLARTIYKTMKIGQVIPRELFVAVAEVLSYVFKLKRKKVRS